MGSCVSKEPRRTKRDSLKKNKKNRKKSNEKNKNKQVNIYAKENDLIHEKCTKEDIREYSDQLSVTIIHDENNKIDNNEVFEFGVLKSSSSAYQSGSPPKSVNEISFDSGIEIQNEEPSFTNLPNLLTKTKLSEIYDDQISVHREKSSDDNELQYQKSKESSEQLMKSNFEDIRRCGESIYNYNDQLKDLKVFHETTLIKRIEGQLFKLMTEMDEIDIEKNPEIRNERKLAIIQIRALLKLLDSKIQCKKDNCIDCKIGF